MPKPNSRRTTAIWLSVLFLLICVVATTTAVIIRLNGFLLDDEGAISLISGDPQSSDSTSTSDVTGTGESDSSSSNTTSQDTKPSRNPGFEASDKQTVWSTNTQVEIFSVSYVNGEQKVTVKSDDGDKVIAPGTEKSYTFKLKNTGNVALDYTVEMDAYFTPADITIPITGRLNRYDGKWIVGSKDEYAKVPALNVAEDKGTLGAQKYTYYTLDWRWLFESGDDELDTMLGNLAVEQDLTFTIVIKTTATDSSNPYDDSGITPPQTGDNSNLALWIVIAVFSFVMMLFLIFYQNKEKRRNKAEADKN